MSKVKVNIRILVQIEVWNILLKEIMVGEKKWNLRN